MRITNWRNFDFWLLGAVALLTLIGIAMIRSSIAGNIELMELNIVQRQLIFALIGFVVIVVISLIDYRLFSSLSRPLFWITVIILAGLYFVGEALFGATRWIDLGIILIQPSELAKIVVILALADFFSQYQSQINDPKIIIRSFLLTTSIVAWILFQPDLSTSILIFVVWFALLWATGLQIKYLLYAGGVGVLAAVVGLPLLFINFDPNKQEGIIKPYQIERLLAFLFPDPSATHGDIYNVQQALVTIGSGGWLGKGYGSGSQVQLRFLKVRHTDFIFSVMAEEFGFIGVILVVILIGFVIFRCLRVARLAGDTFGALIAYGVATLISFQAIVNIGMNLRLIPATGLPLPFISYGGSSLLAILLGIGLVESVILRHKSLEF